MKHYTAEEKTESGRTRKSLLADIQDAPEAALPRRETIVEWLNGLPAPLRSARLRHGADGKRMTWPRWEKISALT